ncbi:hypothetical protein [Variovorax sp. MHTC-1]|uniref:hypothetical protein n=1 Tax=Variovorax sp. MHTC-1 TaxID=2495593 RepID=UPI000F87278E|nr:hypothetical protein [Variovorax sp. MHTC-1]RST48987.1 hypothetical protein EJI01_25070 [Variovorax sp. MHTC-1]
MSEALDPKRTGTAEASINAQLTAMNAVANAREAVQADIVQSFGSFLRGGGPAPTEEQLRQFAQLAVDEQRRRRRLADRLVALPAGNEPKKAASVGRPLRGFALLAMWTVVIPVMVVTAFGPRDAGVASADRKPVQASPLGPTAAVALALAPEPEAPALVREDADATPTPAPAAPRRSARPPGRTAAPASFARAGAWGPLAQCAGLNFIFRAVCTNNRCAQPSARRSTQCAEPLRQRRLDEARRNPLLLG